MALPIGGYIGPNYASKGSPGASLRQENSGGLVISKYLPDYTQAVFDGISYSAANQAAQAISVALNTTYTGLLLYNPVNSGVLLVPKLNKFALSVAPAAIATLGLLAGYAATGGVTAQTAKLPVQSNIIGSSATGKGIALSQATIVTPTWLAQEADGFTAAALPAPSGIIDLKGQFALLPGAFVGFGALTAVTGLGFFSWDEYPLLVIS